MSGYPPYDRPYARDRGETTWARPPGRPRHGGTSVPPSPPLARVGQAARTPGDEGGRTPRTTAPQPAVPGSYGVGATSPQGDRAHGRNPWRGAAPRRAGSTGSTRRRRAPAQWLAVGCLLLVLLDTGVPLLPEGTVVWLLTWQRLLVVVGLAAGIVVSPRPSALRTPLDLPFLLLLAAAAASALTADAPLAPTGDLLTAVGVCYLVVIVLRVVPGAAVAVPLALAATGIAVAAGGVSQVSQGVDTSFYRDGLLIAVDVPTAGSGVRATGTFASPAALAAYLATTLPLAVVAVAVGRRHGSRILLLLGVALGVAGLLAAASRGGLLAASAVAVLALWWVLGLPRLGVPLWLGGIAVLALPLVAAVTGQPRTFVEATGTAQVWETALAAVRERPLLGAGYGQGGEVLTAAGGAPVPHAHNIYLTWGVEAGVAGVAAIAIVLAVAAVAGLRRARAGSVTAVAGLLGLSGVVGASLADHPTGTTRVLVVTMAVLALTVAARRPPRAARSDGAAAGPHDGGEPEDLAGLVEDPNSSAGDAAPPLRGRHVAGPPPGPEQGPG